MPTTRLLRREEVETLVGLSRSAIYAAMAKGNFPRPLRVGQRAVRWSEADLERWLSTRAQANPHDVYSPRGGDGDTDDR